MQELKEKHGQSKCEELMRARKADAANKTITAFFAKKRGKRNVTKSTNGKLLFDQEEILKSGKNTLARCMREKK